MRVSRSCVLSTTHCLRWMKQTNSHCNFSLTLWVIGASMAVSLGSSGRKKAVTHFKGYLPGTWWGWFRLVVGHPLGAVSQQQQDLSGDLSQVLACYTLKLILTLLKEVSLIKHKVKLEASLIRFSAFGLIVLWCWYSHKASPAGA